MGSPVDDALDRLRRFIDSGPWYGNSGETASWKRWSDEARGNLATVREALERLRRHPDAWSQDAFDQQKARAEAAEAEVRQLRQERDALLNWKHSMSASPSDGSGACTGWLTEERDAWKQRHIDSERDWRKEWLAREAAEAEVQRLREERDAYRIEGDHGHDDYEDAEDIIRQIAEARVNQPFDPWARGLCQEFLDRPSRSRTTIATVSERVEAAEAEVQRYREGLRVARDWIAEEAEPLHSEATFDPRGRLLNRIDALLAAPAGEHAEGEGGEA